MARAFSLVAALARGANPGARSAVSLDYRACPRGRALDQPEGVDATERQFLRETQNIGFRLATTIVPEPGTGLLVIAGLIGFAGWRKVLH